MIKYLKILVLSLILPSCTSMILVSLLDRRIELIQISDSQKVVVFFPMQHVGYSSFYQDVINKIDSLNKEDYTFIYESIYPDPMDSATYDLYQRKLRKITGMNPGLFEKRIDTTNGKLLAAIDIPDDVQIMDQPGYSNLGVDTAAAIRADLSVNLLIDSFEREYGTIHLDHCNSVTPLDTAYALDPCKPFPKKLRKIFRRSFVLAKRNKIVAKAIEDTNATKIAVIYGQNHVTGVIELLKERNFDWKEIPSSK